MVGTYVNQEQKRLLVKIIFKCRREEIRSATVMDEFTLIGKEFTNTIVILFSQNVIFSKEMKKFMKQKN